MGGSGGLRVAAWVWGDWRRWMRELRWRHGWGWVELKRPESEWERWVQREMRGEWMRERERHGVKEWIKKRSQQNKKLYIFFLLTATVHIYRWMCTVANQLKKINIAPLLELAFCVWGAKIYQYNFLVLLLWMLLVGVAKSCWKKWLCISNKTHSASTQWSTSIVRDNI